MEKQKSKTMSKQQYMFAKKGKMELTDHGKKLHKHQPYLYDTPAHPRVESNLKRPTRTYNTGIIPADIQKDNFAKETLPQRRWVLKMEQMRRIEKNKKFSENRLKLLSAHGYQQTH